MPKLPVEVEVEKLQAIKRYGWYAMNALRYKIDTTQKAVDSAKQSQIDDAKLGLSATDPRAIGLQAMLDHVEQSLREHREAFDALREAGIG